MDYNLRDLVGPDRLVEDNEAALLIAAFPPCVREGQEAADNENQLAALSAVLSVAQAAKELGWDDVLTFCHKRASEIIASEPDVVLDLTVPGDDAPTDADA